MLTYAGALLPGNYQISPADVALGLGAAAVAMLPGTFTGRRHSARATPGQLTALTVLQGAAVIVLGAARSTVTLTLAVLAVMAFVNGWRSMVASALGMDTAPEDKVAVMAMRAAPTSSATWSAPPRGGLAVGLAGFLGLGVALGAMFLAAALIHAARLLPTTARLAPQGAG